MSGRRRRQLSAEEHALWKQVAKSASPLKGRAVPEDDPVVPAAELKPKPITKSAPPPVLPPKPVRNRAAAPPEVLDRRTVHRLARGTIAIDGRIDLHGNRQEEAHDRLRGYLAVAQANGGRIILVITGKGAPDQMSDRGVLRRAVPHWLGSPAFRSLVSGYEEAHRSHGGSGALYVRLRKRAPG